MTEQQLNGTNVGALFQQVDSKCVSKRMGRDGFRNLRNPLSYSVRQAKPGASSG